MITYFRKYNTPSNFFYLSFLFFLISCSHSLKPKDHTFSYNYQTYNYIKLLGEGQYGVVYLLEEQKSGQQVALKILKEDSYELAKKEVMEHETLFKLNLPTPWAKLYKKDKQHYIIKEYIEGITLQKLININGRPKIKKIENSLNNLIKKLCSINYYIDDLNPYNIMWSTKNEKLYIVDTGNISETKSSCKFYKSFFNKYWQNYPFPKIPTNH